jgi:hypothetical protein
LPVEPPVRVLGAVMVASADGLIVTDLEPLAEHPLLFVTETPSWVVPLAPAV